MMGKYKICVYAISKNEEKFVHRWMDAVSEADTVIVLDTGSSDRTVEKLRERGALVYERRISPWRFDEARNYALGCVPEDTDICVSNDLDEVFELGWRRKLESAWHAPGTPGPDIYSFGITSPTAVQGSVISWKKYIGGMALNGFTPSMRSWNTTG
ncbi:MAG: hypothetical protein RQM92_02880 [Candidatus Syntrophopropionicum ammoniitolerans]